MIRLLATGLYSGLFPIAPGTAGSLAACVFAWVLLTYASLPVFLIATALVCVGGVLVSHLYIRNPERGSDPSEVVIDEVAGQWLTFITCGALVGYATGSPEALGYMLVRMMDEPSLLLSGFIAFRVFDIIKPWPVSVADRHIKGGLGIMLDDMIAGVLAGIMLFAALSIAPFVMGEMEAIP